MMKNIEIIVSDGGSTDDTIQKVKRMQQRYKNIKIIRNNVRGKKGKDIERGIKFSSNKYCIFVDADLSCGISGIKRIVKELKNYDLVIGSRVFKKRYFLRNLLTKSYNLLVNLIFRMKIKDYQCGLKGFKKNKISPILTDIKNKDFFWDTELIIKAYMEGLKIKEVCVPWVEKRKSKIKIFEISLKFFLKLIKLRFAFFFLF